MKLLPTTLKTFKDVLIFKYYSLYYKKHTINKLRSLSHLLLNVMWMIFNESSYIYGTLISEKELQTMLLYTFMIVESAQNPILEHLQNS